MKKGNLKLKILLVSVLLVAFAAAASGCAEVTFRYTDDGNSSYQTVTVNLDGELLVRNGYKPSKVLDSVAAAFEDEGYSVTKDLENLTVVATLSLKGDAGQENALKTGYIEDKTQVKKGFFFTNVCHEGHTAFTKSSDAMYDYVYFTVLMKALQYSDGDVIIDPNSLKFTYEYASKYRSMFADNGEEYTDGELKVLRYDLNEDAVVKYRYRQVNQAAWYGTLAATAVFVAATATAIILIKKRKKQDRSVA